MEEGKGDRRKKWVKEGVYFLVIVLEMYLSEPKDKPESKLDSGLVYWQAYRADQESSGIFLSAHTLKIIHK